jgi:5-hydroxyisourate hydrolase
MSKITTHVLDTAAGRPAANVPVVLAHAVNGQFVEVGRTQTNADGRAPDLLREGHALTAGTWRLRFETGAWFRATGQKGFYPYVEIVFDVTDPASHHHVPLLLSPFGYSTYRGS